MFSVFKAQLSSWHSAAQTAYCSPRRNNLRETSGLKYHRKAEGREGGREVIVSPGIHRKFRCLIRTEEAVGRTTPLSCEQFED